MSRVVLRPFKAATAPEIDWQELLDRVLPEELPRRHELCKAVLKSIFQRSLPEGILQAASSLVALNLESEARALLIDFFRERRGATRVGKRLEMQWIFQRRRNAMSETASPDTLAPAPAPAPVFPAVELEGLDDEAEDFSWTPRVESALPSSDDSDLRVLAADMQLKVSDTAAGYRTGYDSETIPGWDDLEDWVVPVTSTQQLEAADEQTDRETQLLYRLAALGNDGLAVLRYFHVNPGDGARHAADILDYEIADVNKLLANRLSEYVHRNEFGGWECVGWVSHMLELMPK